MIETEDVKKYKALWSGDHLGVFWEISRRWFSDHWQWTYYIYLIEDQLPEGVFKKLWLRPHRDEKGRPHYDYYKAPYINDIHFHGGVTFYEKRGGIDGDKRLIKVGCDYGHIWDEEARYPYDFEWLKRDAEITINALHELIPNIKIRCSWNGKYYAKEDGCFNEIGMFTSNEGAKMRADWKIEWDKRKSEVPHP